MKNVKKNYNLILGGAITAVMLLLILTGFFWTNKFAGISLAHPLGCDNFGRDILSRVMKGAGTTFLVALGTVLIGTAFGVLIGAFTGYFGGTIDEILMRIIDAVFAFPSILLALVFISLLGTGTYQVVIALGIAFIPSFSRIVRSEFLKYKNMDYVKNARLQGASHLRIMFVHILPNTVSVLLSSIMIGFNNAVLAEAGAEPWAHALRGTELFVPCAELCTGTGMCHYSDGTWIQSVERWIEEGVGNGRAFIIGSKKFKY